MRVQNAFDLVSKWHPKTRSNKNIFLDAFWTRPGHHLDAFFLPSHVCFVNQINWLFQKEKENKNPKTCVEMRPHHVGACSDTSAKTALVLNWG
jgi:hypothetical protein